MLALLALAVFAAAAHGQNVWGVTKQNELVYFGGNLGELEGWWSLVGHPFADPAQYRVLIQVADVDAHNGVFYGIAVDTRDNFAVQVFGLNATSGQFQHQVNVPFLLNFNYVNTPGLDWIRGTNDILVYGRIGVNTFQILRLTPSTNTTQSVATWTSNELIESIDAFDPEQNILWIEITFNNVDSLLGFNVNTGAVVFNITDPFGVQSLNFDGVNHRLYGLGSPNGDTTPIVALDSASGTLKTVGTIPYAFTITGPSNAALNSVERALYFYGRSNEGVAYFVAVNVDTFAVVEFPFDESYSTYPVTIAWAYSLT